LRENIIAILVSLASVTKSKNIMFCEDRKSLKQAKTLLVARNSVRPVLPVLFSLSFLPVPFCILPVPFCLSHVEAVLTALSWQSCFGILALTDLLWQSYPA
jgi:hypothetical protein